MSRTIIYVLLSLELSKCPLFLINLDFWIFVYGFSSRTTALPCFGQWIYLKRHIWWSTQLPSVRITATYPRDGELVGIPMGRCFTWIMLIRTPPGRIRDNGKWSREWASQVRPCISCNVALDWPNLDGSSKDWFFDRKYSVAITELSSSE